MQRFFSKMAPIIAPSMKLANGCNFPVLGLGTWQAKPGEVGQAVKDAIDVGYRHIDCAMLYANEKEIGDAINEKLQEGVVKREELFITSKLWNTFHRPELVEGACRKTVKDLGLDYVDLYLMHWPVAFQPSDDFFAKGDDGNFLTEDVDFTETYKSMEKCVTLGLAKSIGLSNFNSEQVARVLKMATIKPVVNQVESHIYLQQKKLNQFCTDRGMVLTAYCPLGAPGSVTPVAKRNILDDEVLKAVAKKYNKTVAQLMLKYLVQIGMVPIPKSVRKERLIENISIFDFELSDNDMDTIEKLDCGGRTIFLTPGKHDSNYPFNIEF